jgi:hypothetical protein
MGAPLATLEVLSSRAEGEPEGTIAMPVRDHVNAATMMSMLHSDWSFLGGGTMDRAILQGSILTMQRNEAVQRMRGKYLLFIDDDMVWKPDAIGRLVATYEELLTQWATPFMVGGLCFRRTPPFQPTLYMRESPTAGQYNFLEEWPDDIVEVDATGCAFLLIPVNVFEAIADSPMPPYEVRERMTGLPSFFRWDKHYGEDLQFCQDAKTAGVRIFVDTRIEVGHIAEIEIRSEHFLRELATRSPVLYAQRLVVNKKMGLPTVSQEKARARLGW